MDRHKLKILLEKYWSADLDVGEERELRAYFRNNNTQDGLFGPADILFRYFDNERRNEALGDEFDRDLLQKLKAAAKEKKGRGRALLTAVLRVAAAVAVIAGALIIFDKAPERSAEKLMLTEDTYNDPQTAYEDTKLILAVVAHNLNRGEDYATQISRINVAKNILEGNKKAKQ